MVMVDENDHLLILSDGGDISESEIGFQIMRPHCGVIDRASVLHMMDLRPADIGEITRRIELVENLILDDANVVVGRELKLAVMVTSNAAEVKASFRTQHGLQM